MVTKTKIAALTAIAALICASPAFAQAYSSGYGTGNNQPSYFDKDGALHSGNMPQPQTRRTVRRRTIRLRHTDVA